MAFPPRDGYERFIYSLPVAHPEIQSSTLHLYANSPTTCFVRGSIWFRNGLELGVFEYLDFLDGELLNYQSRSSMARNASAGTMRSPTRKTLN
jgi:hypothetical protein